MALPYEHFGLFEGEVHLGCDVEEAVFGECFVEAQFPAHLLAEVGELGLRHSQIGEVTHHSFGVSTLLEKLRLLV